MPLDTTFAPPELNLAGPMAALGQDIAGIAQQKRIQGARSSAMKLMQGGDIEGGIAQLMGVGDVEGAKTLTGYYRALHPVITPYQALEAQLAQERNKREQLELEAKYPWLAKPETTQEQGDSSQTETSPRPQSMADIAVDKKLGPDLLQWQQGGFSEAEHSIKSLEHAKELLDKKDSDVSGPIIGGFVKKALGGQEDVYTSMARMYNPEAFNVAAAHQRAVVASLRPLIGARAAQQLFQSVMSATYDPSAYPEENSRRLSLVIDNIRKAANAKQAMSDYFAKWHTLSGYKGERFDPDTFDPLQGLDTTKEKTPPEPSGEEIPRDPKSRTAKQNAELIAHAKEAIEQARKQGRDIRRQVMDRLSKDYGVDWTQ